MKTHDLKPPDKFKGKCVKYDVMVKENKAKGKCIPLSCHYFQGYGGFKKGLRVTLEELSKSRETG